MDRKTEQGGASPSQEGGDESTEIFSRCCLRLRSAHSALQRRREAEED